MAAQRKAIKARIKSVRNTRKITKAMELVAASKMRRAIAQAGKSRVYAKTAREAIAEALAGLPEDVVHGLMQANPTANKTLLVVFSSDRGLAGGLNVNLAKAALLEMKKFTKDDVDVIAVGRKGADALQRAGANITARFPALSNNPAFADLLPAARLALQGFAEGKYKEVRIVYTNVISGISQIPTASVLLPLAAPEGAGMQPGMFEPTPQRVLDQVLPALAETMLWQALLESVASEHAARMLAMKNASDAASDMLSALTFTYNQARQSAITQEIAEISGGKAALE